MPDYPSCIADLAIEWMCARARANFQDFRCLMRPELKWGWWMREICDHLQQFYRDQATVKRPKIAIEAPPQHGKSLSATDFAAWSAGQNPDAKVIFASFSAGLGERTNLELQRLMRSPRYMATFGRTRVGVEGWQCNGSLLEFADHTGSFRNTTVSGQINGFCLNLGIIDDPVKGRLEASKHISDQTWAWFTDDFMPRFAADGALLIIMTRWGPDDLLGRAKEKYPELKVFRYPAIAEEDERHRRKGEALFPEHKPLDFLLPCKNAMSERSWEAQYQQNPMTKGGGQLPVELLKVMPYYFDRTKISCSVRYWDKAGTVSEDAAFTAGVLMHKLIDGTFVIEDIARGRWSTLDREQRIKMQAQLDAKNCKNITIYVEQEPGSGGKESAENSLRNLAGFNCYADRVTGKKEVRAEPFVAQVQAAPNCRRPDGRWRIRHYLKPFRSSIRERSNSSWAFIR
jgi:hypothetical protein